MWSSSRDNWERLVAAVLRREHDWELAHAPSRSPSISTLSSASSRYWSRQNSSVSQDVSAPLPPPVPTAIASSSQVGNRKSGTVKRGGIVAGATNIFAAPRSILTALYRRRKIQHHTDHEDVAQVYGGHLRRFSLSELEIATDKFSRRNILGRGGFSMVYKGRLADGSLVGVKRLRESAHQKVWIQTEMMISSMAVDPNILCLLGFCIAPGESLLVYPFMSNGNVASRLRERPEFEPPLDWPTRMRIALGTARGLAYLHEHCGPKIIHRDVKAAEIFLDEDMEAVVGGFECAKFLDHNDADVETAVRGTMGHIAPEYLSTGRCSVKSDVFAYGIFLLELISAQRAFDLARLADDDDVMLLDWVKGFLKEKKWEIIVDADLQGNYRDEELEPLLQLAVCCTLSSPNERPSMSEIVLMLETDDFGKLEERLHPDQTSDQGLVAQEQQEEEWDEVVLQQEFNSCEEMKEFNRRGEEGEGMLSQQEDFKTRWKESQEKED